MFRAIKEKVAKATEGEDLTVWMIMALGIITLVVAIWMAMQGDLPKFEANPHPIIWMPGKLP